MLRQNSSSTWTDAICPCEWSEEDLTDCDSECVYNLEDDGEDGDDDNSHDDDMGSEEIIQRF